MKDPNEDIAIIVPFNEWTEWVVDCVDAISRLDGLRPGWTVWLVSDEEPTATWRERLLPYRPGLSLEILSTGSGNPSQKRNAALRRTKAPVVALIDSDAWPSPDWLVNALKYLEDDIGVVTGPNLTPPDDEVSRRVCGRVMESPIGFGEAYIRHVATDARDVREMPTCNMVYRRAPDLLFHEELATGEDMVFCSEMRAAGRRVVYRPDVCVYHHRRKLLCPFMKQFFGYGLNKGRLWRMGSDIAYRWHALPTLFLLYLAVAVLGTPLAGGWMVWALWIPLLAYLLVVTVESARMAGSVGEFMLCIPAFLASHLSYGAGYLAGYLNPPQAGR